MRGTRTARISTEAVGEAVSEGLEKEIWGGMECVGVLCKQGINLP
jgi:hypothetical protein